ncbi:hypothetical protein ABZP36_032621 [Zizania latifolia]
MGGARKRKGKSVQQAADYFACLPPIVAKILLVQLGVGERGVVADNSGPFGHAQPVGGSSQPNEGMKGQGAAQGKRAGAALRMMVRGATHVRRTTRHVRANQPGCF